MPSSHHVPPDAKPFCIGADNGVPGNTLACTVEQMAADECGVRDYLMNHINEYKQCREKRRCVIAHRPSPNSIWHRVHSANIALGGAQNAANLMFAALADRSLDSAAAHVLDLFEMRELAIDIRTPTKLTFTARRNLFVGVLRLIDASREIANQLQFERMQNDLLRAELAQMK